MTMIEGVGEHTNDISITCRKYSDGSNCAHPARSTASTSSMITVAARAMEVN